MRLPRLPKHQAAYCTGCDLLIVEGKRKPCPRCGDTRRRVHVTANESIGAGDRA